MVDPATERDVPSLSGPEQRVRNAVSIYVLDDGQVVFGDLPPELAEVADLLAGLEPAAEGCLAKRAESVVS